MNRRRVWCAGVEKSGILAVMRKFIGTVVILVFFSLVVFIYIRVKGLEPGTPAYGVTFSKPYAESLGLDWRGSYRAILDDLGARMLRIPVYWNEVAPESGIFRFDDYDWLVSEAAKRRATVILAVGRKLPRWPECHSPEWASILSEKEQEEKIRDYIITTVNRYKSFSAVVGWQVENEPFLRFGDCPRFQKRFLDQEIALVRGLDAKPIMVTDSGELSLWVPAARRADWFGTTMYRHVWTRWSGYFTYPLPPAFFKVKRVLTELIARPDKMLVIELQAEPWLPEQPPNRFPLEEQLSHMDIERFQSMLEYAQRSGFDTFYLWGTEWWWWLKTKADRPEIWNAARGLFPSE